MNTERAKELKKWLYEAAGELNQRVNEAEKEGLTVRLDVTNLVSDKNDHVLVYCIVEV